jgi:putative sporulation protein YyaC
MGLPVVVCIGTENIIGDSLGPCVGALLKERYGLKAYVYGVPEASITAKNIGGYMDFIARVHKESAVIAVDACLGNPEDVGGIRIRRGGVKAGRAAGRNFPAFGDVSVLGVVEQYSRDAIEALLASSPDNVFDLTDKIAYMVNSALAQRA